MRNSLLRIFTAVCIVISVVCAVYLFAQRFCFLNMGFSYDELYSAATASPNLSLKYIFQTMLLKDINLPLFNVLLYGWNHIFPYTEFWMHLFSALAGALAVLAGILLFPKKYGKLYKLIFVCLMAATPILVVYSSNVRAYSWAVLCSTIFTLLSLKIIDATINRQKVPNGVWIAFFFSGIFGSYLHYFCSALFFITAFLSFIYALCYKNNRIWILVGTAICFLLWSPFPLMALAIQNYGGEGSIWWFELSLSRATWDILTFLFGSPSMIGGLLCLLILAGTSIVFTFSKKIFKQIEFIIPALQIFLLIVVIAIVSLRFNLWLDRYFLPAMPSILLLLAGCLFHLYQRHKCLIVLIPIIFCTMINFFWSLDYLHKPEWTGLKDAFSYVSKDTKTKRLLVDFSGTGYTNEALYEMFRFYGKENIKILQLTQETLPLAFKEPKTPLLVPLCSQVHLINASVGYGFDWDGEPLLFGNDICLINVHSAKVVKGN